MSPKESAFLTQVMEVFGFLVTEHGFVPGGLRRVAYEMVIEFLRPPVAVCIIGISGGLPEIRVEQYRGKDRISHGLASLSRKSLDAHDTCLPTYPYEINSLEYTDVVNKCLSIHAQLLRTHGQHFLQGDPSQLQGVRPGQFTGG